LGLETVDGPALKRYGFDAPLTNDDGCQYLLFPYCDPWGEPVRWGEKDYPLARVKLPEEKRHGKQKYAQPKGSPVAAYIPWALADFHSPFGLSKDGAELGRSLPGDFLVTEGEKKAIAATLSNRPCIGIGGVNCFRALWLQEFVLNCRTLTVFFDSDIWSNSRIQDALVAFSGWTWQVQKYWFIKSNIVPAMDDEAAADWESSHDAIKQMLPEMPSCYDLSYSALTSTRMYFGLLPLGYQGAKMGLDDYLYSDCNAKLRNKILGVKLPLNIGGQCLARLDQLWDAPKLKTSVALIAEGDGKEWYWCSLSGKAKPRGKDVKLSELKCSISGSWPISHARDLLALLVVAYVDFQGLVVGDLAWRWTEDQIWECASPIELDAHYGQAISDYGFADGNTGIDRLVRRCGTTWLIGELPPSDYIGLADCDLNTFSGESTEISPRNYSQYRVAHIRKPGSHPLWDRAVNDLFADRAPVFWAMLRVAFAHPKNRGLAPFLPCILGDPGIGKSALLRVLSEGLGGVCSGQKITDLYSNTANRGYIPLNWLKSRVIYDDDFKGRLTTEAVAIINTLSTGSDIVCRQMGKDPIVLPCSISLIILANKIPTVSANDAEGFHRRFLPIQCESIKRDTIDPFWHTKVVKGELPHILDTLFSIRLSDALLTLSEYSKSAGVKSITEDVVQASYSDVVEWLNAVWSHNNASGLPDYLEDWRPIPQLINPDMAARAGLPEGSAAWVPLQDAHVSYTRFCRVTNSSAIPKNKVNFAEAVATLGGTHPQGTVRRWVMTANGQQRKNCSMIQLPLPSEIPQDDEE
jgi:hypothetical protein